VLAGLRPLKRSTRATSRIFDKLLPRSSPSSLDVSFGFGSKCFASMVVAKEQTHQLWAEKSAQALSTFLRPKTVVGIQQRSSFSTQPNDGDLRRVDSSVSVNDNGSELHVTFPEGESVFHASWLWSNDPTFFHPSSGQRKRSPSSFFGWKIQSAEIASSIENTSTSGVIAPIPAPPNGCLHPIGTVYRVKQHEAEHSEDSSSPMVCVTWERNDESALSYYNLDWLWRCRYDDAFLHQRKQETDICKAKAINRRSSIRQIDYARLEWEHDEARYDILEGIIDVGAVLVQSAPLSCPKGDETVGVVGRALSGGTLSHGQLYGDIFHVLSIAKAHNIAYTTDALPPHHDLAYYVSKPGLQLLHCVKNEGVHGGESVLIDAMGAADEFRQLAPDLFDVLIHCEATFLKQREGADMVFRRPHIEIDSSGSVVAVHWSPPFEGPLCIQASSVNDYYVARSAFERMLDNSLPSDRFWLPVSRELEKALIEYAHEYSWEQRLQPGEILIFNNQRMLHGRRGFTVDDNPEGTAGRHLIGCYTDMDDTLNQYRLLRRERSQDQKETTFVRNVGNGSSGII